jgi:basic membrane lipoprotein Med (substrate-binding protein (PBP1-ABC) superfamily)
VQANAFMMGVRRAHPTATVLLYGTGTWAPDGMFSQGNLTWKSDLLVGKLLLRQGADIITQHTNGLGLSSLVHNASTAEEPRYTLGVWSNMGATLGDHVLVSALNVWAPCFLDYARQVCCAFSHSSRPAARVQEGS